MFSFNGYFSQLDRFTGLWILRGISMTVNTEQAAATRLSPFFRVMDDPAGGRYCSNGIRAEGGVG